MSNYCYIIEFSRSVMLFYALQHFRKFAQCHVSLNWRKLSVCWDYFPVEYWFGELMRPYNLTKPCKIPKARKRIEEQSAPWELLMSTYLSFVLSLCLKSWKLVGTLLYVGYGEDRTWLNIPSWKTRNFEKRVKILQISFWMVMIWTNKIVNFEPIRILLVP